MADKKWERWLPTKKLSKDEEIVFFLRRHWFIFFSKYLFMFVLALIPVAVYLLVIRLFPDILNNESIKAFLLVLGSLYYFFIWLSSFTIFIDYYLDIWIVTNHRIIDIEQRGLFNHVVSEQSLEQVQDVSSNVKGIFPTFLDYGHVLIQSAAAKNLFHFKQIPNPAHVARGINSLAEEFRKKHRGHA